ncbi:unnamed protein product [Victoria cruziana]
MEDEMPTLWRMKRWVWFLEQMKRRVCRRRGMMRATAVSVSLFPLAWRTECEKRRVFHLEKRNGGGEGFLFFKTFIRLEKRNDARNPSLVGLEKGNDAPSSKSSFRWEEE